MAERLILGYPNKQELIEQIEAHLKPGEMVMTAGDIYLRGYHLGIMTSTKLEAADNHQRYVLTLRQLILSPPIIPIV